MGFNGKKIKVWIKKKSDEAKKDRAYKKTASGLIRKRAKAEGYVAEEKYAKEYARKKAKLKYKRKYKAISSPSKGNGKNAIGDWIAPSGFGSGAISKDMSMFGGGGGIYSPYNLRKEKKRAKRKRSLY